MKSLLKFGIGEKYDLWVGDRAYLTNNFLQQKFVIESINTSTICLREADGYRIMFVSIETHKHLVRNLEDTNVWRLLNPL